jgi:hypothetical protein
MAACLVLLLASAALQASDPSARSVVIAAAHSAESSGARHALREGEPADAWVYLGRRSDGRWRPASASIERPPDPVRPGGSVVVRADALVYGAVDCEVTAAADFKPAPGGRSVWLVRADREPLRVLAAPLECPSAGRARTVWVNVHIPASRLMRREQ